MPPGSKEEAKRRAGISYPLVPNLGDGLRDWKATDAGARTYSLYDGTTPVAELNSSGTVTAVNTFGAAALLSRNVTGYGNTLYAFDERGNVAHRTYQDGSLVSTDLYDAYGKQRSGASDAFGFGGQAGYYTDTETGLILCTHRFYDPQSGRFLTRDPIGYGGLSLRGWHVNPGPHSAHIPSRNGTRGEHLLGARRPDRCDLLIIASPSSQDFVRAAAAAFGIAAAAFFVCRNRQKNGGGRTGLHPSPTGGGGVGA